MNKQILGIHHVTAICGHPQPNLDFYAGLLGLRLVKLTVNFDDPTTYHLYYGDGVGTPGTILTFFPWPGSPKGRQGVGQVTQIAFAVPEGSLDYWTKGLTNAGVRITGPHLRFDESVLSFHDPDGMVIELVAQRTGISSLDDRLYYANGPVPREFAIHGFHSATLLEGAASVETARLLIGTMGLAAAGEEGNRFRYRVPSGGTASVVDILIPAEESQGRIAAGSVHHIAWRTPDDEQQGAWLKELQKSYDVSPVMDRKYFHSIYFREPGNVLFEIATDPPGFAVDEPLEELGTHLVLPPWLEPRRVELEAALPKLRLPAAVGAEQ